MIADECDSLFVVSLGAGFGVIHSDAVEAAFRAVDRRFFVPQVRFLFFHDANETTRFGSSVTRGTPCREPMPLLLLQLQLTLDLPLLPKQNRLDLAHSDQPLREGHVHISAPHIYGCIAEALDVIPNSSLSFLNVGSGTGYLSSIVAHILGPTGVCYGVEINRATVDHCLASMDRWKAAHRERIDLPHIEFIHGNGLQIDAAIGESLIGYDRIYVGAAVERASLNQLALLLRMGGILVAPGKSRGSWINGNHKLHTHRRITLWLRSG